MTKPIVIIESPFAGETLYEKALNILYARECMKHSLLEGEAPYASHLLYTQPYVLPDVGESREMGIKAGFAFRVPAEKTAVYQDRGISNGMKYGIADSNQLNTPIEYRNLPNYEEWLRDAKEYLEEVPQVLDRLVQWGI